MLGVYISMMNNARSLLNGGMSIFGGLSADELVRSFSNSNEDAFTLNALSDQNPLCSNLYTAGYNWIYDCNNILEKMAVSTGISDSVRRQLRGEASFSRALVYFYLVNLFGDIPLVTTTDYSISSLLPRSPAEKVYRQIIADLETAQTDLKESYVTTAAFADDRTRPNKAAATALLARIYLYQGEWVLAAQAAGDLIGNDAYRLETDLDKVFLSGSKEAIWQLQPVRERISTAEGNMFVPLATDARPVYILTPTLLGSFETGDQRLLHWVGGESGGNHYLYPFKYKLATDVPFGMEYNTMLRLSEQYLIRAEARARQGKTDSAAADLNIIRRRAGLEGTPAPAPASASGSSDLIAAIMHERQIEFFAECGHRWLDLKRTGWADSVLGVEKPGWRAQAALYPIPFVELRHNPYLVQNAGY